MGSQGTPHNRLQVHGQEKSRLTFYNLNKKITGSQHSRKARIKSDDLGLIASPLNFPISIFCVSYHILS